MPYIHLANGSVVEMTNEEMNKMYGDNAPVVYVDNDTEYQIVGIFPDGVKLEKEKKEEKASTETTDYPRGKK